MDMSNKSVLYFLKLIEKEPVIWNPRLPDHKVREAVHESWRRIKRALAAKGVVTSSISVVELKKKKDSLMARYRSLATKVKLEPEFKPTWFAYEAMAKFMDNVYRPLPPRNNGMDEELADAGPDLANSSSVDSLSSVTDKTKFLTNHNQSAKRLKLSTESTENEATSSKESLPSLIPFNSAEKNNVARQIADKSENHFTVISTWCDLLQCKLKEFDEYTREFLMNQIDNYVFRARVKQLKQKKEERKKMEASAGSYVHPVHSIQHVHPLYVDVASTSGLNSNQNRNQDNDKSNVSPTGSHSSLIEIKEERVDIDEEF
ncbi:hypothetical protein HHI36_016139 [Cryptolaemus montrouzieri]|uniref:MADF domain-containing protein n=1 Tax=Cryptolaemus montrouzieri TaxID=559131 RepID=A0ABD2NIN1_9CUCU